MPGHWVKRLDEIPLVPEDEPGDPLWYPLQHHFGFTAFGVNVYTVARGGRLAHRRPRRGRQRAGGALPGDGRERAFTIDGEETVVPAGSVVAITDPRVRRAAVAAEPGTTLAVVGGRRAPQFESSWQAEHFTSVPTAE